MMVWRSVGSAVMHPSHERDAVPTYERIPLPVSSSSTKAASSTGPPVADRYDVRVAEQEQPGTVAPNEGDAQVVATGLDLGGDHFQAEFDTDGTQRGNGRRLLARRVLPRRPQQALGDPDEKLLVDPVENALFGGG